MAKHDLYHPARTTRTSSRQSELLFCTSTSSKGSVRAVAQAGMALVIRPVRVVLSTYLSRRDQLAGDVPCCTLPRGWNLDFIRRTWPWAKNAGGGPGEAMRPHGFVVASLDHQARVENSQSTASDQIVSRFGYDAVFRWACVPIKLARSRHPRCQSLRHDQLRRRGLQHLHQPADVHQPRGVYLFGYLLPWAVLGFYLIRWREVASTKDLQEKTPRMNARINTDEDRRQIRREGMLFLPVFHPLLFICVDLWLFSHPFLSMVLNSWRSSLSSNRCSALASSIYLALIVVLFSVALLWRRFPAGVWRDRRSWHRSGKLEAAGHPRG